MSTKSQWNNIVQYNKTVIPQLRRLFFVSKKHFEDKHINADCLLFIARKSKVLLTQSGMRMERKEENVPAWGVLYKRLE